MLFTLLPIIDLMTEFYQQPATADRFHAYIKMLEGDTKGSLSFPAGGFNPMAKTHMLDKLNELKQLDAENIMKAAIERINSTFSGKYPGKEFNVALNLSDDLKGGWTNRYTSDYDSKFRISGLLSRNFCIPVFWTGEQITKDIIQRRTEEYVLRTIYRANNPSPLTLHQHLVQESFVAHESKHTVHIPEAKLVAKEKFYDLHKDTTEYSIIFNFFYGDSASGSLSFATYGNDEESTGFDFAAAKFIVK